MFLSMGLSRSLQRELNDFFRQVLKEDFDIQTVTKGALTQARSKLRPEAFKELNAEALSTFYEEAPYLKWRQHRLLAVDSSTLELPDHPSVRSHFGTQQLGCKAAATRSMSRISMLYDVLNLTTLDGIIAPFSVGERDLLRQHLDQTKLLSNDLLLMDRGYPGIGLMMELNHKGIAFCMRLQAGLWSDAKAMIASGEKDKIVTFLLPKKERQRLDNLGISKDTIDCRLIVIELENGIHEVLCTSLTDPNEYPYDCFKQLYQQRWQIEEAYKLFKCRVSVGDFSGKTAQAVQQDFYAKIFMMTICAALSHPIAEKVRQQGADGRKHDRKINRTNALGFIKASWVALFLRRNIQKLLQALEKILLSTCQIVRPYRSFSRDRYKRESPPMTYKQL